MFVKDLNSLKYAELQKLAKSAGIKANQKVDKLMKALKEHYLETEENCTTDLPNTEESGSESEELTAKPVTGAVFRQRKQGATRKNNVEVTSTTTGLTDISSPLLSPLRKMAASLAELRKATPLLSSAKKTQAETLPTSSDSTMNTPDSKAIRKRRRTFELDEPTLSAQATPVLEDHEDRGSTRLRTSLSDAAEPAVQQEEPVKKRVRRNTYDVEASPDGNSSAEQTGALSTSSPGTKAMIEEIDANLPSAERKQKLLSALDRKIRNKVNSPAHQTAAQPSQIPRFVAFLANKKVESQKPVTPGNKDWTKIHSKEFSKFDSLDVYLERKQQRMEKLSGSAKKPSTVNTRRGAKIVKPVPRPQVPMASVKPVTRLQVPMASVKPFVPTVTSTNNLTFNFSKTPAALKTPGLAANEVSGTPRMPGLTASTRKSVGTGNRATPFIFTGNNASNNTTVTSVKKSFDLKASLSKPLTWKPHTGRLQPLDVNKPQAAPAAAVPPQLKSEKPSRQAMASKTRPTNAKNVRRAEQLGRRNNQKYIDMMKRRGLMA